MQSDRDRVLGGLDTHPVSKEREQELLAATRVDQLESFPKKAQEDFSSLSERYQQLKEDFQFNLALLDERDRELEMYDVLSGNSCMDEQVEACEWMKWDLQCRIQQMEQELTLQRQEMAAAFERKLRQQEHEFNLKMDAMRGVVLSHDLKVKLLSIQMEVQCQAQLQATETLKESKQICQKMQTRLQHKEQEIKDLSAVKDYRIKELEDKLKWMETKLKMEEDNHIKKYEDVIQALKECDAQLEAQYQTHTEQLLKVEKHIIKLQKNMEVLAARLQCIQIDQQETMEQKDETIQRLRTEVETTRTGWDKYITHISNEMAVKDTIIITLQWSKTKLRTEWERSKEEMTGYKSELRAGLEREKALEERQVQAELEWQRRCETMKAEHYLANEQLIQDLSQARDQGLTGMADTVASEEVSRLQEQNSNLRAVVTQMRKDMEGLSHLLPHPKAHPQPFSPQPVQHHGAPAQTTTGTLAQSTDISCNINPAGYIQALEQELSLLKVRCRHLEGWLEDAIGLPSLAAATEEPTEDLIPIVPENMHLQNHGQGGLCLENENGKTSDLMNPEAREEHIMKQLHAENLFLQQQQDSGVMSGGLFENLPAAKSNPPRLHSRLKQAAFCIARLSREKQQLIEMGNRLRGQITTAGLKGWLPERDSEEHHQDRLSALERLQYQLTTQELQYARRQRACTFVEQLVPGTKYRGPATKSAAKPWSQGHKTIGKPESFKNKENAQFNQTTSSLDVRPQSLSGLSRYQSSTEESLRSLNKLWEILDHGLSPCNHTGINEGKPRRVEVAQSGGTGVQIMVRGITAPMQSQPLAEVQQRRNPSTTPSNTTKTSRPRAPDRISKIRNYNVKD